VSPFRIADVVPKALLALPQWVCWRYEKRKGKETKVPINARTGKRASSKSPADWVGFEVALAAFEGRPDVEGIGFVFAEGGPFCGVDLDDCLDPATGEISPWAHDIVKNLDSYSEISPSGGGVKVFLKGRKPGLRCRKPYETGKIEIYDQGRFFTVTGRRLSMASANVEERQEALEELYALVFDGKPDISGIAGESAVPGDRMPAPVLTDDEIIEKASSDKSGEKFRTLWAGDWNSHFNSPSEADSSLVFKLAFYTKDAGQIDRIFRRSKLMRSKWDEMRGGATYGAITVANALDHVTEQYTGGRRAVVLKPESPEALALLERGREFAAEHVASPDVKKLAGAVNEYLWRLPDIYLDEIKVALAEGLGKSFKVSSFNRAVKAERRSRGRDQQVENSKQPDVCRGPELRNYREYEVTDEQGNTKICTAVIPIDESSGKLLTHTGGWPRRVGPLLFYDQKGTVRYLERSEALFAWAQEQLPVYWSGGQDSEGRSLVTKPEFQAHLAAITPCYDAVEEMPHEPAMPGHYYAWKAPELYEPTGECLAQLLDFFDNPETDQDRALMRAAFLTPAWGGLPGKRPAFVIMAPDRGYGKSTLAEVIGMVYGGYVELTLTESAEDKLVSRLLTPNALAKRVVRVDNIKRNYSSELLESLITAPVISGHRLYHGEAWRPNTLTYILTGNALKLSRDLAERAFVIRLKKPTWRRGWDDAVKDFVFAKRPMILADIAAELRKPAHEARVSDRWMSWVNNVLARSTPRIAEVVSLNNERRGVCDEDREECEVIMAAIDTHVARQQECDSLAARICGDGDDDVPPEWAFVSSTDMTTILSKALNEHLSSKAARQRLDSHIEAGRLPRVIFRRTRTCNGYQVSRQPEER
jgi:hypothetical protein